MPRSELALSGYKVMWLMAMFDLPVTSREARRRYAKFRKVLLENGFSQLQYSVYARCCDSEATAATQRGYLISRLPREGHIRLLYITDRQFGKMEVYFGKKRQAVEQKPQQLELF
jgi:CRISPR-associated protein Cas2